MTDGEWLDVLITILVEGHNLILDLSFLLLVGCLDQDVRVLDLFKLLDLG